MTVQKHFIFYGNSSMAIGSGHIMRLFALAQWIAQSGFAITFLYKECLTNQLEKPHNEGFATIQIQDPLTAEQITPLNPSHLVIDDYDFSEMEWEGLKKSPCFKIVFDDSLNQNPLPADLIINTSPFAYLSTYKKRAPHGHFCLGPEFTLLRKEFVDKVTHLPNLNKRNSVLITMGGTDVLGLNLPLCTYFLKHYPSLPLKVLIGTSNSKQLNALQALAIAHSPLQLYINPKNVAELMRDAGLALSAAGGTLNELACMQVPTIALVCADNQAVILNSKTKDLWCEVLDFRDFKTNADQKIADLCSFAQSLYDNKEKRLMMQQRAQKAIAINGGQHIVDKIISLSNSS